MCNQNFSPTINNNWQFFTDLSRLNYEFDQPRNLLQAGANAKSSE